MKIFPQVLIITFLFCFGTLYAGTGKVAFDLKGTFYGKVTDAVTNAPAPRLITEVRGNFKKINNSVHGFYVKIEADNTFAQNNIFFAYNTETATPGYTMINAGVGADFVNKNGTEIFSVNISGNNLGDVAYQNHLSRLKYAPENLATGRMGVFNMGRNFSVKLNIPFSYKISK